MKIWRFSYLRIKQLLSTPKEILFILIAPISLVFIIGSLINIGYSPTQIPIAFMDQDQSEYSRLIIARVKEKPAVQVTEVEEEELERLIKTNKLEAGFVIKKGFQEAVISNQLSESILILKSPSSISTGMISQLVASEVIRLSSNVLASDFVLNKYKELGLQIPDKEQLWQEAWAYTDQQWEPVPLMGIHYMEGIGSRPSEGVKWEGEGLLSEPRTEAIVRTVGLLGVAMMLFMIFSMEWLIIERGNGVFKRIRSTPTHLLQYIVGNTLGVFTVISLVSMAILFYLYLSQSSITLGQFGIIVWIFLMYLAGCVSLSLCLGLWLKTREILHIAGLSIVLLTSLLGGVFLPVSELVPQLSQVSNWVPQGVLLQGIRRVFMSHELVTALTTLGILGGYSVSLFIIAVIGWRLREKR